MKNHLAPSGTDSGGAFFPVINSQCRSYEKFSLVFRESDRRGRGGRKSFAYLSKPPRQSRETFFGFFKIRQKYNLFIQIGYLVGLLKIDGVFLAFFYYLYNRHRPTRPSIKKTFKLFQHHERKKKYW